ncbi:hypothetical protein TWF718_011313 [Orbilia javanica]|uniref:Uncharacterized protein n=1 Tax=Orbilia javanica TaxID=47235 RepID=A0AAN8MNM5_9PEZI
MCEKDGTKKEGNAVTIPHKKEPIHGERDAIIWTSEISSLAVTHGWEDHVGMAFDCESGHPINQSMNQNQSAPLHGFYAIREGCPSNRRLKLKFEARAMSSPDPGACFGLSQTANTSSHTISICPRKDTSITNDGHISLTFNSNGQCTTY